MGRNKVIPDTAVLDALLAALGQAGPDAMTFSKSSKASGLSAATLVQRFGHRDAMIEAILVHAWDRLDAATIEADAECPVSPAGAIAMLMRLMPPSAADTDGADGLLLLREDFRNPALRARGHAWGTTLARALGRRLTDRAELAERLGWQMASVWQGAIIWWGFRRDADPETDIRAMLEDWCRSVMLV